METRYFPFIRPFGGWWTIHVIYLSDGAGLVPNRGTLLRSDGDVVMG